MDNKKGLKKRERSANFTSSEFRLLVSLIVKYKHILENKRTDTISNERKYAAWKIIANKFNASGISEFSRSIKTLKIKYYKYVRMTKSAENKEFLQREEMYKTEQDGASTGFEFDDIDKNLLDICSNVEVLHDDHNCDSNPLESQATIKIQNVEDEITISGSDMVETELRSEDPVLSEITENNDELIEEPKEDCWVRWPPDPLKAVNKESASAKLTELNVGHSELLQVQIEIAKEQLEFIKKEHRLKLQHLKNDERRKQQLHAVIMRQYSNDKINFSTNLY